MDDSEGRERERDRGPNGKRCDDPEDAQEAGSDPSSSLPTPTSYEERRRQKEDEQEEKMVCPFSDVTQPQLKQVGRPPACERCPRRGAGLGVVQFIGGLNLIPLLGHDADPGIARSQRVHKVDRSLPLVVVFENELPVGSAARQLCGVLDVDFANAVPHLLNFWEVRGFKLWI